MTYMQATPLPRRSVNGYRGGRPLGHDFWFAPRDGDLHPSQSQVIQSTRLEPPPLEGAAINWMWALGHARLNQQWLVIALTGDKVAVSGARKGEVLTLSEESADVRSSLLRTAKRIGLSLVTQKVGPRLYLWANDA